MMIDFRKWTLGAALICAGTMQAQESFSVEEAVKRCDVDRTTYVATTVNLYQGNGEMGCSYGPLGLHLNTDYTNKYGETKLLNLSHRVRARYDHDYLVPLLQVYWNNAPATVSNYNQHQSYYDGTIETKFTASNRNYQVQSWFDPVEQNLGFITVNTTRQSTGGGYGGSQQALTITIDPMDNPQAHYDQKMVQQVTIAQQTSGEYKVNINCTQYNQGGVKNCAIGKSSDVYISTNATVSVVNNNLQLTMSQNGNYYIRMSYGKSSTTSAEASLEQTKNWWHQKWDNQGMLGISDLNAQQTWVRSMAMFLSSYDDQKNGLCPPLSFTGTNWSFYYPQDVSYVHPVFVQTGNIDIARSWIEKWASEIDGQREYTKRRYKQDGVMIPWVYPYNGFDGYHQNGFPMHTYGQIHQGAYYVRMAAEVANVLQDEAWTRTNLMPILQGVAEFYGNIASKHADGMWHFYNNPSCGQDEFGGDNQTDYIDVLYSAQYVFQEAVKHGIDPNGKYSQILTDGIAFPALLDPTGSYYYAYLGGSGTYGKQKHPAQLNELLYDPCYEQPTDPAVFVYKHRNDMTVDAKKPFYWGWTLGAFLLAGSRLGLVDEWKADWANMSKSDYVDQEWIQSFETSTHWNMAFYNINNGLIVQSLLNNLVCDWFGRLEIAKCNPWTGTQYIRNIISQLGVTVNGTVNGKDYDVTLTAWKDCSFQLDNQAITLQKGQSRQVKGTAGDVAYEEPEQTLQKVLPGQTNVLEAENALLGGNVQASTDNNSSGGMRVGYIGEAAANTVTFTFDVETAGTYDLTFYCMSNNNRRFQVTLNDDAPFYTQMVNSGGWNGDKMTSFSVQVTLESGKNTIVLGNPTEACPNLDRIELTLNSAEEPETPSETQETVTISLSSYGQGTYSSAYHLDFSGIENLKAYVAGGYDFKRGSILLTRVTQVPAGVGVMLKGTEGDYKVPVLADKDWYYNNMFVGVVTAQEVPATENGYVNYIFSASDTDALKFYRIDEKVTLGDNRAYLQVPASVFSGTPARVLNYEFEDELTGIDRVSSILRPSVVNYFDLQGRRAKARQQGIVVRDGKKIVRP